ncbi:MAG: glycosyltransferase family 2 protein [Lentisphaeria bacterium]|nr:glycosyltransferase family 2 protein [Lentisphaerota bacterium]MBO5764820.1 glycosyltransferase family 2 protein [Lentisphaeria bacterium]MBO5899212.1 glycosyltransferase family 2 protein [Lentisphaeria bacterium]MBO5990854.1 glycosyltransferase family 2 protein [Lentisphaeria bacterium]MBO7152925.1 glycosyltransferase family 2 protein [Lentisphaeria bacterium]
MNNTQNNVSGILSVVMPAYNEENSIEQIVNLVLARPEVGELIIVNDASTDKTWEKLQVFKDNPVVKLINVEKNQGKGAALIRGFSEATKTYVLVQDADFEYSPEDYPIVLAPLLAGKADVVYGSRFMCTPGQVRYFGHEMGNKLLTLVSNIFSDIHLSDMETCYKCFKREVIQNLKLTSKRFGIEVEMTAKLAKSRCLRIWDVPITYAPRRYDEGKKIGWKDGVAAFFHIVRFNMFTSEEKSFVKPWNEVL